MRRAGRAIARVLRGRIGEFADCSGGVLQAPMEVCACVWPESALGNGP